MLSLYRCSIPVSNFDDPSRVEHLDVLLLSNTSPAKGQIIQAIDSKRQTGAEKNAPRYPGDWNEARQVIEKAQQLPQLDAATTFRSFEIEHPKLGKQRLSIERAEVYDTVNNRNIASFENMLQTA